MINLTLLELIGKLVLFLIYGLRSNLICGDDETTMIIVYKFSQDFWFNVF